MFRGREEIRFPCENGRLSVPLHLIVRCFFKGAGVEIFKRPERGLKDTANQLLEIIFDPSAEDFEVRTAALTLVELIAPDVLEDSIPKRVKCIWDYDSTG